MKNAPIAVQDFFVVGISHKKAPLGVRARFHISEERTEEMMAAARACGLTNMFALATCNRTEVYGFARDRSVFIELLIAYSDATADDFMRYGFSLEGKEALHYLFRVGVGLESQILGDLQIFSQVKNAFQRFREGGLADGQFHRLLQHVSRANKRVKTRTNLSRGAASIAYAAIRHIYEYAETPHRMRILVIGAGHISRVLSQNLIKSGFDQVRLVNRTPERAAQMAGKVPGLQIGEYSCLAEEVAQADVVIVATGAQQPVLTSATYKATQMQSPQLVIDLAVPRNVDAALDDAEHLHVIHMDHLNDAKDEALAMRRKAIPEAEVLVEQELAECTQWMSTRKVAPAIEALKTRLEEIRRQEVDTYCGQLPEDQKQRIDSITSTIVRQIANHPIHHLKENTDQSEELTELLMAMFRTGGETNASAAQS
jgi:glutamyl-tRNA reductase